MATIRSLLVLATICLPSLAQQGPYFVLGGGGMPIVIERIDPALAPGRTSSHVHSVVGGNGWKSSMTYADTQSATCSNLSPKADKSNYWMPNLYFQDRHNGSFIRVPEQPYHKIYYKFGRYDNTRDQEVEEFPKEFRMVAGNPSTRSYNDATMGTSGTQIHWMCHGNNYQIIKSADGASFPKFSSCPNGFAADIRLPSCWNGNSFNANNPSAHMAYPTNQPGRAGCPAGFQKARFPEIFIEYWFDVNSFDGLYNDNDSPWVLSHGDPTGYGFHLDFLNGWQEGVLNAVMPTCNPGNTGSPQLGDSACFGRHGDIYTDAEMNACRVKPTVQEDVGWSYGGVDGHDTRGGVLDKLPGCNPVQPGPNVVAMTSC